MKTPSLALLLAVSACGSPMAPGRTGDLLTIENRTSVSLAAFPYVGGSLIDPVPLLEPGTYGKNFIAPGGSLAIDSISGYRPGLDAGIFLYLVQADHTARYLTSQPVLAPVILHNHGIVRIESLPRSSEGSVP